MPHGIRKSTTGSERNWKSAPASTPISSTRPARACVSSAAGWRCSSLHRTMQFKVGIWYIDRVEIKLLPAVRHLCGPPIPIRGMKSFSPPRSWPIAAQTVGNHNVWAYIRGEYGGGAWTASAARRDTSRHDQRRIRIQRHSRRDQHRYFAGNARRVTRLFRSGLRVPTRSGVPSDIPEQSAFNRHGVVRRRIFVLNASRMKVNISADSTEGVERCQIAGPRSVFEPR